jgi:anti-sigma factor RsiW
MSDQFTEAELHAYVDGQLPPARADALAIWLNDPARREQLEQVRLWRSQNQRLQALHDDDLNQPLPAHLVAAARRPAVGPVAPVAANASSWQRYAFMLLLTLAGGAGGWLLNDASQQGRMQWLPGVRNVQLTMAVPSLARQAAIAHSVYSPDLRRPVEVGADQEQALVTWLSRRIGAEVRAPKLAPLGFDLIGGRLLPGQSGPVAQFMYQDAAGQRLTLYVSRDQLQSEGTGFRFAREGKVNVFYWIDGKFGYALSGGIDRNELSRIATSVYDQLDH